jgi:hypothetical protein
MGTFSKAERSFNSKDIELPGPGDYTINELNDSKIKISFPKFTKRNKKVDDTPAHYDYQSQIGNIPSYIKVR